MRQLLITFLMCTWFGILSAQPQISLLEAIKQYESSLDVKFSYDPVIFSQISRDFSSEQDLETFISAVESQLPIKIEKIGDNYYTILLVQSEYSLKLSDSLSFKKLEPPFFFLINSVPVDIRLENDKAIFSYKPNLNDTLIVYAPGFEKKQISTQQLLNAKSLRISLMTQTYFLNDVVVEDYITKGINLDPASQKISIDVEDLPLLPGETDGDIFASLAALPGITTPDGRPGNLFIRGNSVDQSLVLFDNIPIYHRGHYFGTISPYNPKVIKDVEVYRSGYHPRMGGRVGGAVFINSDDQVTNDSRYGIGANTLFATAYGRTPMANQKIGLVFGARHSYPTSVRSPKLNTITESVFSATGLEDANGNITTDVDVIFQDYQAKIIARPNEKDKFSLSGIYSNSYMGYEIAALSANDQNESMEFENYGINTEWNHDFSNRWSSSVLGTFGSYTYESRTPTGIGDFFAKNIIEDYNVKAELSHSSSGGEKLTQFGVDYKWQSTLLDFFNANQSSPQPITVVDKKTGHIVSPYANMEWNSSRWSLQAGLRGSFYSPKQAFYLDPRIATSLEINPWVNLKASAGRYHQFLSQVRNLEYGAGGFDNELWLLTGENEGAVISGEQYMAGFIAIKDDWLLDVEAYFKTANNITYYDNRRLNLNGEYFTADNKLFGVDTYLKRAINSNTSAWIGYSYGGSEIKLDTTDQKTYETKYVQPHVFYIGSAFQKNRWKLSAVWKYGSGLNAESLEIVYAEVIYQRAQANRPPGSRPAPNPFENVPDRYPSIHSLDLSASYTIPYTDQRPWSASFGLSVINLYDRDNLIDRAFRGDPPPPVWIDRHALGFAPNLMVTFEW